MLSLFPRHASKKIQKAYRTFPSSRKEEINGVIKGGLLRFGIGEKSSEPWHQDIKGSFSSCFFFLFLGGGKSINFKRGLFSKTN